MPITAPLPSLNAGAGAAPAPKNTGAQGADGQFGAALSHEIGQRNEAAAHDGAAAAADKPAQQDSAPVAGQKPRASEQRPAGSASGDDGDQDDAGDQAAAADPAAPADMLAMVASINHLLKAGAVAPEPAPASAGAAGAARTGAAGPQAAAADAAALVPSAVPTDAAARFAALMRGGQPAASDKAAPSGPTARHTAAAADISASLAPSQAPDSAPAAGLAAASPSAAPSMAPSAAPAALSAEHLAASTAPSAAPDQVAAQLLAASQVQQAAPSAAQAAAQLGAANHIPAQLGTPAWDNQVGQKIVWMVAGGEQSASLTLNPPDLGPMQVVLSVNGDQASVAFSSSHQDVRHALESALPRLREMMGESGIALGSATVDAGMPDQRQAPQQGWQAQGQGGTAGSLAAGPDDDPAVARPPTRTTVLGDRGMVDTFA